MTTTNWQTVDGGTPIELAAFAHYDLSVIQIGMVWRWQVTQAGRDVTEGVSNTSDAAKQAAERAARAFILND
jgi:regulator of protease activity HflC (stomatin/prohibitin superfamily)